MSNQIYLPNPLLCFTNILSQYSHLGVLAQMRFRKIKRNNLLEIILIPLIFLAILGSGLGMFFYFEVYNYFIYTTWCIISGMILLGLIIFYTYHFIKPGVDPAFELGLYQDWKSQTRPKNDYAQPNKFSRVNIDVNKRHKNKQRPDRFKRRRPPVTYQKYDRVRKKR